MGWGFLFVIIMKKSELDNKFPTVRQGELHKVENYDMAAKDGFANWHLHHRLELTINGEFANSFDDLKRLGMYYRRPHYELIFLPVNVHGIIHSADGYKAFKVYASTLTNRNSEVHSTILELMKNEQTVPTRQRTKSVSVQVDSKYTDKINYIKLNGGLSSFIEGSLDKLQVDPTVMAAVKLIEDYKKQEG
jgi:hypothetical protein